MRKRQALFTQKVQPSSTTSAGLRKHKCNAPASNHAGFGPSPSHSLHSRGGNTLCSEALPAVAQTIRAAYGLTAPPSLAIVGQLQNHPDPPLPDRPSQGPVRRRAHWGRKPWGSGGCRPPAVERLRRGRDAGGRQQAVGRHCLCLTPQRGVCYLVFCHWPVQ